MLILRRRIGETLLIGDSVKVTIMDIYEGGVRIAIDAPREITVLRSELLQAADFNRDAADGKTPPHELLSMLGKKKKLKKKTATDPEDGESGGESAGEFTEEAVEQSARESADSPDVTADAGAATPEPVEPDAGAPAPADEPAAPGAPDSA